RVRRTSRAHPAQRRQHGRAVDRALAQPPVGGPRRQPHRLGERLQLRRHRRHHPVQPPPPRIAHPDSLPHPSDLVQLRAAQAGGLKRSPHHLGELATLSLVPTRRMQVLTRLTREERRRIAQLYKSGMSYRQVMAEVGRSMGAVQRVIEGMGGVLKPSDWAPSAARLSLAEREEISRGLERDDSFRAIAGAIGRDPSTVSREVNANGGRSHYRAWRAHRAAQERARRPKPAKLASCPKLRAQVEEWLGEWWSPEQIARSLREEFPDDPMMWVSHETIYQSLFVQGRGALRRELAACLRSGRAARRPRGRTQRGARVPDMVMISERPAEVEDRAVPGHWEGDLIIGKGGRSAVGTLVERASRYVLLLHLPRDRGATAVREAMAAAIQDLPGQLVRSITWDQGSEM